MIQQAEQVPWKPSGFKQMIETLLMPRKWAWHTAIYVVVVGSVALYMIMPESIDPLTPPPASAASSSEPNWWKQWFLYVIGAWSGILGLHGLLAFLQFKKKKKAQENFEEGGE